MSDVILSKHARLRMGQRGIRPALLDIILDYGESKRSGHDFVIVLTDRSLLGTPFESLAHHLRGLSAVLTSTGVVKTVQRLYRVRRRPGVLRRRAVAPPTDLPECA